MKKISTSVIATVLALILVLTLIPTFAKRLDNESRNKNVVISLYYNDLATRLDGKALDEAIDEFYNIGVTTVSLSEENVNAMVARGDVTNIKYNVLRHKYDDESIELAEIIAKNAPETSYNSELLITKDDEVASFVREHLADRMTNDEYAEIEGNNGMTVFSIYEGILPTSEIVLGYNEDTLDTLSKKGFDICLVLKLQDNSSTRYLDTLEQTVKKYGVKYLSIRKSVKAPEKEKDGAEHYERLSRIISDNNLTLVVTETPTQLSNEKPFGYSHIFKENNTRVLRSYETYDASHADPTNYMFRYQQYLNSTIDRNIRFITVSQIHLSYTSYEKLNEYTLKAAETYIDKIQELGYTVNGETSELDYNVNLTPVNAVAAAIMVLLAYVILCTVFGIENKKLFAAFAVLALCAFGGTFVLPGSLQALYSTAWAVVIPCFGMTTVFAFLKNTDGKIGVIPTAIITPLLAAVVMSIGGIVMSSLLSGIDYYINNDIFRGIKLSLFLPLVYAVVAFYFMFMKGKRSLLKDIKTIAMSDIKVYWIAIAAVIGIVGLVYIRRSGNVNTISGLETAMRNFITDTFAARPRTKEFLIGYPCLVLLVYYLRKTNLPLIQIILAAGGAIVTASISNSFCHVFTDAATIYMRVVNGVLIGAVVCVAAYLGNLVLVWLVKRIYRILKEKLGSERN